MAGSPGGWTHPSGEAELTGTMAGEDSSLRRFRHKQVPASILDDSSRFTACSPALLHVKQGPWRSWAHSPTSTLQGFPGQGQGPQGCGPGRGHKAQGARWGQHLCEKGPRVPNPVVKEEALSSSLPS